jgi:hypothetical protein
MAKYKELRADIRGRENRTIWNAKPDTPVSLSHARTTTAGSLSGKRSRTPPRRTSEGLDRRQQDNHPAPYFSIGPPMPELWGHPSMTYPHCPPWVGWYRPWAPPPMHFHPGWSGHAEGFGHGDYYTIDGRYEYISHEHDRRASGQERRTVRNAKLNHLVSPNTDSQRKRGAPNDGSPADESRSDQRQKGSRNEASANEEAKPNVEKGPKEVSAEQDRVSEVKAETKKETGTNSQRPPNRTVQFPQPDHPVSGQREASKTTTPGTTPVPHWCPPGLTFGGGSCR